MSAKAYAEPGSRFENFPDRYHAAIDMGEDFKEAGDLLDGALRRIDEAKEKGAAVLSGEDAEALPVVISRLIKNLEPTRDAMYDLDKTLQRRAKEYLGDVADHIEEKAKAEGRWDNDPPDPKLVEDTKELLDTFTRAAGLEDQARMQAMRRIVEKGGGGA